MERIFLAIYNYFEKHRPVLFTFFTVVFLIIASLASQVKYEEDISRILPRDKKIEKLNQVFKNSKFLDKLVVTVSLNDTTTAAQPDSLVAFAVTLAASVHRDLSQYIYKINDKVDDGLALTLMNIVTDHIPVFLDDNDYRSVDSLIQPGSIKKTLENNIRTLTSPAGIALKNVISKDPVGISFLGLKKLQQLQYDDNFALYDSYVVTKDYKHLVLFITPLYPPDNTGMNGLLLKGLDDIIDSLHNGTYKNIHTSYFGATAVSAGNAAQLRKDMFLTQGITIVFLVVFIGLYFKKKRAPFIIMVPVLFGALFSLAAIYIIKGSISVIALGTGSVVLGIAVSYSLHVFNHYRHTNSVSDVIKDLAQPLTIGSFTTIGGFLCLEFVESEMLKDLGLFAAFSLIGASLCSLIFLPHFIATKKEQREHRVTLNSWINKLASYRPEYNKGIVIAIFLMTVVFAYTARQVGFESDMMHMNFMSPGLRIAESDLNAINAFSLQSVYLVSEGKTLNQALVNNEKAVSVVEELKTKGIVKKYSGVSSLIISGSLQKKRIDRWNTYWTSAKKQRLINTLKTEGSVLKFKPAAFDNFKALLNSNFQVLASEDLKAAGNNLLEDFITESPGHSTIVTLVKVAPGKRPALYKAFENREDITAIDKQYLTSRLVEIVNSDFTRIALMSSILVFVVMLLTYGRIELTLVSFIPMFISWIWILGIMGIFNIQFNIINIIISALIFGLGDDYSLFIMDGLLKEYKTGRKNLSSYKSSIFLSAITTIAGLGVLIFARHPALKSIAIISIIGILCVVLMSQILIPFFFNLLIKARAQKKYFPWTFSGFLKSAFAFCYFVFGSVLLTVFGLLLVKWNPFDKERGKLIYHKILSSFSKSIIYIMVNVKKEIIKPLNENFSTPAVIICNHQSFLDILLMVMLSPKIILLTNSWVYSSPVFGAVVRMADYYPVTRGAEMGTALLAERIKQGYSIVVFPEGTRSADGNIKRFHKGAFYLAEKLHLDMLPIIMHGTGYTMTKGDFLLKDGKITLKFLPRIKIEDDVFGKDYASRAKNISRYLKKEFQELSLSSESPAYFKEQLVYNYLYKGPVLEWYMKIKLRLEKNYQLFHDLLPKQGKMLDIGCGYGFMSYLLHFAAPGRNITGIDYDKEKVNTAQHCFSRNESINFYYADVTSFSFEKYDAIVLADMLHYLEPEQQKRVIEKCIKNLDPGGLIIIRDGNKDLEGKHKGTMLTEFFSTNIFGFNKTTLKSLSFLSGSLIKDIAALHGMSCTEIDETRFTSNMVFVIRHPAFF